MYVFGYTPISDMTAVCACMFLVYPTIILNYYQHKGRLSSLALIVITGGLPSQLEYVSIKLIFCGRRCVFI